MATRTLPDQEYLRQCFDYDPDTGLLSWKVRPRSHFPNDRIWNCINSRCVGAPVGALTGTKEKPHLTVGIGGTRFLVHRVIWKWLTGEEPPEVDHRDGDETNNRQQNLRAADRKVNALNMKRHSDGKFLKGAYKNKKGWCSKIMRDGVIYRLGTYRTPEEAHAAYCKAAAELHGEWANFGREDHSTLP